MTIHQPKKRWYASEFLDKDEAEAQRLLLAVPHELGTWLAREFVWHHVMHPTFRYQPSEERASVELRKWLRRLELIAQQRVGWVAALERGAAGRLHYHVLTVGTEALDSCALVQAWRAGRAVAERYDRSRGAPYYLAKRVCSDLVDFSYDIAPPHKLIRVDSTADPAALSPRMTLTVKASGSE